MEEIDGLVVNLTGPLFRDRIRNVSQLISNVSSCIVSLFLHLKFLSTYQIAFTSLNNLKGYITDFLNDTATLVRLLYSHKLDMIKGHSLFLPQLWYVLIYVDMCIVCTYRLRLRWETAGLFLPSTQKYMILHVRRLWMAW